MEETVAVSPTHESKPMPTLADRLCSGVLRTARAVDTSARISSVAKLEQDDSTLLHVSTDSGSPLRVADMLRRRWPLAAVSVVHDVINGNQKTQVLIPSGTDQLKLAREMARESSTALWLALLVRILGVSAAICFVTVVALNVALLR
tara:strand:+ start:190 stop:630 length:441 start_codon:yes stop_codon:yes gene_type:complete